MHLDECFGFVIYEQYLNKELSAAHPSQFLFSTEFPGLSSSIGMLKQNVVTLDCYRLEDPDIDYYEEVK